MSRWTVARDTIGCLGGCRGQILPGEPMRLVSAGEWPCCTRCAKRRFDMEPPAADAVPSTPKARFSFATTADLANDFKRAQGKDEA